MEPILQESPLYMVTGRDSPVRAAWSTSIWLWEWVGGWVGWVEEEEKEAV